MEREREREEVRERERDIQEEEERVRIIQRRDDRVNKKEKEREKEIKGDTNVSVMANVFLLFLLYLECLS